MILHYLHNRFIQVIGVGQASQRLLKRLNEEAYLKDIHFISGDTSEDKTVYYNLYTSAPVTAFPEIIILIVPSRKAVVDAQGILSLKEVSPDISRQPLVIGILLESLSDKESDTLGSLFDVYLSTRLSVNNAEVKNDILHLIAAFHDLSMPGWSAVDFEQVKKGLRRKGKGVIVYKNVSRNDVTNELYFLPFSKTSFTVPKEGLAHTTYLNMVCNEGCLELWKKLEGYLSRVEETTEVLLNLPLKSIKENRQYEYPCTMLLTGYKLPEPDSI